MPTTLTRSLLVVLVPGLVACAPWAFLLVKEWPEAASVYERFELPAQAVLFAVIVVVGAVFENLGTRLEVYWDRKREEELRVRENWYAYLARVFEAEPVCFRYISRMVTKMYFELSMMWASLSLCLGLGMLFLTSTAAYNVSIAVLLVILGFVAFWLFRREAKDTHEVLCRARLELNRRLDGPG